MVGVRQGAFTCVGWQVTLSDPIWQVASRSSEMGFPWRAITAFTFFYLFYVQIKCKFSIDDGTTGYARCAEAYPHVKQGMLSVPTFRRFHKGSLPHTLCWCDFRVPKCTKFIILWGCTRDPTGGAYSSPQGPLSGGRVSLPPPQEPLPRSRPFGPRLSFTRHTHILFHGTTYDCHCNVCSVYIFFFVQNLLTTVCCLFSVDIVHQLTSFQL